MMIVELRPHIGQMATALGVVDVEHDQWIVMAGVEEDRVRQVGYLCKKPGSKVQPILSLPDSVWGKITDELMKLPELKGWTQPKVVDFSTVVFMDQPEDEQEDVDDGDE